VVIDFLFSLMLAPTWGILATILPAASAAPGDGLDLSGVVKGYTWLNSALPLSEFFALRVTSLGITLVLSSSDAVMWIVRKLPFVNMS